MRPACLLIALALAVTACGDAAAEPDDLPSALCAAVAADSAEEAARVFETDVHAPLHTLADEVGRNDRALAARLLEAKYAVESAVRGDAPAPAPVVEERLQALVDRVHDALAALDRPTPDC